MPNIGPTELIIVLVIVLLIFGPKRLPGLGKQLGSGVRDFKSAVTSHHDSDDDDEVDKADKTPRELPAATAAPVENPTAAADPVPVPVPPAERTGSDAS